MKVTLQDIATTSGYSVTTVSRALGGHSDVNEKTRHRIQRIAEELGYVPNQAARNLQSQKANAVALVIPLDEDFSNSFFMELLVSSAKRLASHEYNLLISAETPNDAELMSYQRLVAGGHVDGIIVARVQVDDPRIAYLQSKHLPFVAYGHDDNNEHPFIDVDSFSGTYQLTHHFIEQGHRRIAMITGPEHFSFAQKRLAGFRQAMSDHHLPISEAYVIEGQLNTQSGIDCGRQLLALENPPSAIVACNDLQALGAIQVIRASGLVVGKDIAVGGFDDIPLAANADPPLTTVRQPIAEIGEQLVDMLLTLIQKKPSASTQRLTTPALIIRESSGLRFDNP